MTHVDPQVRAVSLALAEISRTLESMDVPEERVHRALELARSIIPYSRCAALCTSPSRWLVVTPTTYGEDTDLVRSRLQRTLTVCAETGTPDDDGTPDLVVPIRGTDQVIGVICAEARAGSVFDANHARLMTVVAAQLGAYLTMLKLRDDEARSTRKLAAAQDFHQQLIGIASHELRNPLSVVTVAMTNLLRKKPDPETARTFERTLRSVKKANRVIADLIDVTHSRVHGELHVHRHNIDLRALLIRLVEDIRVVQPAATVAIHVPVAEVTGEWDPARLEQALSNLIHNALLHSDTGTPVRVTLAANADDVSIAVNHQGPIIPPEVVDVMFNPFKPGAAQHRPNSGLGLGLYVVRQVAAVHRGRVDCLSTELDGTTFTLTLPRHARVEAASPVLVVDDDGDIRAAMVEALEDQGYPVVTAANGERALERLRNGMKPRVVLLDINMPVMDGATLWSRVQEDPELRAIPVLILSSDHTAATQLAHKGAAGFLSKPLQVDSLLASVRKLTGPVAS